MPKQALRPSWLLAVAFCAGGWTMLSATDAMPAQNATVNVQLDVPLRNFHQVSGTVYRGCRPSHEGLHYLAQMGIRTIINLEDYLSITAKQINQEQDDAALLGIDVITVPLSPIFRLDRSYVETIVGYMGDPSRQPIYVHCKYGLERTGFIIGLHRVYNEGWSPCQAYSEMRHFGYRPHLVPVLNSLFWRWTEDYGNSYCPQ